jgi:hypothetical protein
VKILFTGKNFNQALKNTDRTSLAGIAISLGMEIVQSLEECPDFVICVDYKKSDMRLIREAAARNIRSTLVINEPQVVIPQHGSKGVLAEFDKVLFVGRSSGRPQLRWPQTWRALNSSVERINSAVIINADKWSFVRGQLYWLRSAIASCDTRVEVYGHGWDRRQLVRLAHRVFELLRCLLAYRLPTALGVKYLLSRPLRYKGLAIDKVSEMARFKVAVVIENSPELLTEKLFDAWFAGCIPVYVGPKIGEFQLPTELAIQSNPTITSLKESIDLAFRLDYGKFLAQLDQFLLTEESKQWRADYCLTQILKEATS